MAGSAKAVFRAVDADGGGSLTFPEFRRALKEYGMEQEDVGMFHRTGNREGQNLHIWNPKVAPLTKKQKTKSYQSKIKLSVRVSNNGCSFFDFSLIFLFWCTGRH